MSSGSAAPCPNEQPEDSAGEPGYFLVRTPTGSEREERRPNHRRAPKHVREMSRQMEELQEEIRQVHFQQSLWFNATSMHIQGALRTKADADQVPTKAAFQSLWNEVQRSREEFHEFMGNLGDRIDENCHVSEEKVGHEQLKIKLDESSNVLMMVIPDMINERLQNAFEQLQDDVAELLGEKPNRNEVHTIVQMQQLLDDKPNRNEVHTIAQMQQLLGDKANRDEVHTIARIQELLGEKPNRNEVHTIAQMEQLLDDKANRNEVHTIAQMQRLLDDKANRHEVHTIVQMQQLLGDKANRNEVHTTAQMQQLLDDKANRNEVHTIVQMQRLLDDKANGQYMPIFNVSHAGKGYHSMRIGHWILGETDSSHFAISHCSGKCALVCRIDGNHYPGPQDAQFVA